ncbi:MAG: hypothetical protein ACJ76Z_13800 [Thermoleophilaceae bacterium]
MTGHLSYLAANEHVADLRRAADNHRAAGVANATATKSRTPSGAASTGLWSRMRRRVQVA